MTCIELSELNGRAGNLDYFARSREAEQWVLTCVTRLLRKPVHVNTAKGKHTCDFTTQQGYQADVKIYSSEWLHVEITQIHRGVKVPGWYGSYCNLPKFGGLLAVNHWFSKYHNKGVFKIRWIPWDGIQSAVQESRVITNSRGSYCRLDPTRIPHFWLGDFMQVPSAHGDMHVAFDASRIHSNNQLNIRALYEWF